MFFSTLLITGIRKTRDMNSEHEAAINRYKNTCMLDCLELLDSLMIASVELLRASRIELRQFFITKETES